ncbi:hypothetical protein BKA64DRAFT_27740 [Cadophora sp. MPI-SDFR-AT-0126]|nr:hypothetical protein BKA64DRAFT_27740 [Leotiomycetes sp. MPI-SDFR-AT-0126]
MRNYPDSCTAFGAIAVALDRWKFMEGRPNREQGMLMLTCWWLLFVRSTEWSATIKAECWVVRQCLKLRGCGAKLKLGWHGLGGYVVGLGFFPSSFPPFILTNTKFHLLLPFPFAVLSKTKDIVFAVGADYEPPQNTLLCLATISFSPSIYPSIGASRPHY